MFSFLYWLDICPLLYVLAEFINLISSESNEVCGREEKRTIAPEHVLKALEVSDIICLVLNVLLRWLVVLLCLLSYFCLPVHLCLLFLISIHCLRFHVLDFEFHRLWSNPCLILSRFGTLFLYPSPCDPKLYTLLEGLYVLLNFKLWLSYSWRSG